MTTRERILACYGNQPTDRPACAIYTRYLSRGQVEREARDLGMGIIEYVPPVSLMPPPWHMLPGFMSEIVGAKITEEHIWSDNSYLRRRSFETPDGSIYADIEDDAGGVGSEHIVHRYLNGQSDYKTMLYVAKNAKFRRNQGLIEAKQKQLGEDGVVLGRLDRSPFQKCLIELARPDIFLMDILEDPDLPEELLSVLSERLLEEAEMALDSAADALWLPDNVTAEMTSPLLFARYCLPYYRKLTNLAHQAGKIILAHFDGKIRPLLSSLKNAGFDGIESVSLPEMNGDMTVNEARAALPGTAILPNFPANRSLDSAKSIEEWLRKFVEETGSSSLLLQISEDLPPEQIGKTAKVLAETFRNM